MEVEGGGGEGEKGDGKAKGGDGGTDGGGMGGAGKKGGGGGGGGNVRRIQQQGRHRGVDPVLFLRQEDVVSSLEQYYGIGAAFQLRGQLVTRSADMERLKRIYYVSKSVAQVIALNFATGEQLKMVSTGLKVFVRTQTWSWRVLSQVINGPGSTDVTATSYKSPKVLLSSVTSF